MFGLTPNILSGKISLPLSHFIVKFTISLRARTHKLQDAVSSAEQKAREAKAKFESEESEKGKERQVDGTVILIHEKTGVLQDDTSCCSHGFVDIKSKVAL